MSMVPTALVRGHNIALADELRARIGMPIVGLPPVAGPVVGRVAVASPVVTLADPTGEIACRLAERGARVSSRAERVRIAFHIWNTSQDVDLVASALSSITPQR